MRDENKAGVILVADDEPADVERVRRVLIKARLLNPVYAVANGLEAISYLAGNGQYADRTKYPDPVLLLLDLAMPNKSGLEVLDWLRNSTAEKHRVIGKVLLTGSGNLEQIRQAYGLGAHSFLTKPVTVEDFLNLVSALKGIRLEPVGRGRRLVLEKTLS